MSNLEIIFGTITAISAVFGVIGVVYGIGAGKRANAAQERATRAQEDYNTRDLAVREAEVEVKRQAIEAEGRRAKQQRLDTLVEQFAKNEEKSGNRVGSFADLSTRGLDAEDLKLLINECHIKGKYGSPVFDNVHGLLIEGVIEGGVDLVNFVADLRKCKGDLKLACESNGVRFTTSPSDWKHAKYRRFPMDDAQRGDQAARK